MPTPTKLQSSIANRVPVRVKTRARSFAAMMQNPLFMPTIAICALLLRAVTGLFISMPLLAPALAPIWAQASFASPVKIAETHAPKLSRIQTVERSTMPPVTQPLDCHQLYFCR